MNAADCIGSIDRAELSAENGFSLIEQAAGLEPVDFISRAQNAGLKSAENPCVGNQRILNAVHCGILGLKQAERNTPYSVPLGKQLHRGKKAYLQN